MNVFELAVRNVARNRRRSGLTAGIVMFGFAAFALAGGFVTQTFETLRRGTIRGGTGHLQFAREEAFRGVEDRTLEHGLAEGGSLEAALASDPSVESVLPRIDFVGLASNGSRSVPYLGVGLDPETEARAMDARELVSAGRWLADRKELGAVVGTGLAAALGLHAGDTVSILGTTADGVLNALDLTVVGLADIPVKELNDRYLATSLEAASRLLAVSGVVSKLVVTLRPNADEVAVRDRLLARARGIDPAVSVRTWMQLAVFYGQVRLLYIGIFGFMGAVLVIVVLLACANTMTMAAAERTREIGTLRAIGTPPGAIRRMFVLEGMLLASVGSLAGAAFALGVRVILNASHWMLPPPPGATHGSPIHVEIYALTYAAGFAAMVATLALAAYLPARRASRIPIVEALAHV